MSLTRLDSVRKEKKNCGHVSLFTLHRRVCAHLAVFVCVFAQLGVYLGYLEHLFYHFHLLHNELFILQGPTSVSPL